MYPILSWRRIVIDDIETPYIINIDGIVMNDSTGKFMKYTLDKDDYPTVKLKIDGENKTYKIHRLVSHAFKDNPFKFNEVDHINRNHWDNNINNLEYVSGLENHRRMIRLMEIEKANLTKFKNVKKDRLRYTDSQILQVCIRLVSSSDIKEISDKTSVDISTIYGIFSGKIWKHISCYFSFNNFDSIIGEKELMIIHDSIEKGLSDDEILTKINILPEYHKYFYDIINKIKNQI